MTNPYVINYKICASDIKAQIKQVFDNFRNIIRISVTNQPKSKFEPVDETAALTWASEHKIGIASDLSDDMKEFLRAEFAGECSEVGMYLAMSRAAIRQGYPEVGAFYRQAAFEEADHASRYAEMLGAVVSASTKENLEARVAAENGACAGKTAFAKKCKEMGLDALHDSIHEMARDEARHGQGFKGLLDRYFGK